MLSGFELYARWVSLLHAHRKMLQVLTQQTEEKIHSRGTVNNKLIASALYSDTGKGECFVLPVR